jgi:hypothetical protein
MPQDDTYRLENDVLALELDPETNGWALTDKRADVTWGDVGGAAPWVALRTGPETWTPLRLADVTATEDEAGLYCALADDDGNQAPLALVFRLDGEALLSYVQAEEGVAVGDVALFEAVLQCRADEEGAVLAPIRMGLFIPAEGEAPFEETWGTYEYEGLHMAMLGLFKEGAALMAAWHDPYTRVRVARATGEATAVLSTGFILPKTARSLALYPLGPGDLTTLAEAYRERAEALGYRVPWEYKLQERPQAARLFGACNFKLWHALARRVNEDLEEVSTVVQWTFDEVAQIAEHLRHDVELEDVLFHIGGWTRYGYDCRHPDIMPANWECGGNAGLEDCAQRVQELGYLFCLHDNYQDMYRDAPSWDEYYLQREADGSPHIGGVWLGGQAYYTCARAVMDLVKRRQNLPAVAQAFHPDIYFIDTTYAVGPQECYDPRHPLTRQQDIEWKQELSDYSRDLFGMFGSECGREWAVPHSDFFEGLASVRGDYYHRLQPDELGARVVPFFDMVLRDCIAIHGKYGYDPKAMAEQVIHHVAIGRPLYYHSVGHHLYWEEDETAEMPPPDDNMDMALYTRGHNGWAEGYCLWDRFMKNTQEVLGPLHKLTAQALIERYEFLDDDRRIRQTTYSNGVQSWVNGSESEWTLSTEAWGEVTLPPYGFFVEAPSFVAFCATSFNGHNYDSPVLFCLRSQDARALTESQQVRVFHGFGDAGLSWRDEVVIVQREEVLT